MSHPLIEQSKRPITFENLFQRGKHIFKVSKILPLFKAYNMISNKFDSELLSKLIVRWKV